MLLSLFCVTSAACAAEIVKISEVIKAHGRPVVIASGYDSVSLKDGLIEVSLYSVTQDVDSIDLSNLPKNTYLVFSDDYDLRGRVCWHFESMHLPHEYTGSTMFASRWTNGTSLEIVRVNDDRRGETVFRKDVSIVYLEVGAKGQLIRQKTKPRPLKGKEPVAPKE